MNVKSRVTKLEQAKTARRSIIPRATIAVRVDVPTFEAIADMAEANGLRLSIQARELLTQAVRDKGRLPE